MVNFSNLFANSLLMMLLANVLESSQGRLRGYPRYRNFPIKFQDYIRNIYSKKQVRELTGWGTSGYQRLQEEGLVESYCEEKAWIFNKPDAWNTVFHYIYTSDVDNYEFVGRIAPSGSTKHFPLMEMSDQGGRGDFFIRLVALRQSATPGCMIFDVTMSLRNKPTDAEGDCHLILVNGLLTISCPPDELPEAYRILSLFSVGNFFDRWHNGQISYWGFQICAERAVDKCNAGPALALSNIRGANGEISIIKTGTVMSYIGVP